MEANNGRIEANLVDIETRCVSHVTLAWRDGLIVEIARHGSPDPALPCLLPGFVDAHVHIESSMLVPSEFARLAVRHGTVAAVSDPHEIANVLGEEGVRFMLDNAASTPFRILFGAPACVPATPFETAGATLDAAAVARLLDDPRIGYLSEMMNFPGVLAGDPEVQAKLAAARARGLPVDGHAPGLRGGEARRYAAAGILTDHECRGIEEAEDKLAAGMKILIREGSAARDFDALHPLIDRHAGRLMFCSDDKHPDDLAAGHIDRLVARAVAAGHDLFDVLRIACLNPIEHYRLPLGRLRLGDPFDAALVADLVDFRPRATWLRGVLAAQDGRCLLAPVPVVAANRWQARPIVPDDLRVEVEGAALRVIVATDGELVTREIHASPRRGDGRWLPDPAQDLLLLLVMNRYRPAPPALAFVRGFGLGRGALASSVAHDSHNLVAVGADLDDLLLAVNALVAAGGGIAVAGGGRVERLPLPVAGLMSDADGDTVAARYAELDALARGLGGKLRAPFMTLSFMALLVIPELKLSDRGLFDGRSFGFVPNAVAA
ncbi:adenine deaminase [Sulfurisoma sediminicola]|uniref:Adenine deaminase n=1 Tax=Sulfurisoma sediminicola TaxID=1381557 RepID=A0A497XI81_9PROT|nr:adenine deaminase [Sulfurisoma sediminicola]RLJ67582.1 adenine deaminase [Sulfurisoma sediminicola]